MVSDDHKHRDIKDTEGVGNTGRASLSLVSIAISTKVIYINLKHAEGCISDHQSKAVIRHWSNKIIRVY